MYKILLILSCLCMFGCSFTDGSQPVHDGNCMKTWISWSR